MNQPWEGIERETLVQASKKNFVVEVPPKKQGYLKTMGAGGL